VPDPVMAEYLASHVQWLAIVCGAGGKILLNKATLRLKKGRRYGLCGANGVGKVPRKAL